MDVIAAREFNTLLYYSGYYLAGDIETNLGMPYIYLIPKAITKKYSEKLF